MQNTLIPIFWALVLSLFAVSCVSDGPTWEEHNSLKERVKKLEESNGKLLETILELKERVDKLPPRRPLLRPERPKSEGPPVPLPKCSELESQETSTVQKSEVWKDGSLTHLSRQVRIIPQHEGGKPVGFRFFGIRKDSVPARLGFKNGDTFRAVNGIAIHSPDSALEAYSKLKDADEFRIVLRRRGEHMCLILKVISP